MKRNTRAVKLSLASGRADGQCGRKNRHLDSAIWESVVGATGSTPKQ